MIPPVVLLAVLYPLAAQTGPGPALAIAHQAVDCVVAEKHPRLEARFPVGTDVASAKVFFRGATREWYSVAMKPEGASYAAVLPSPKKDLKEFHYYIEATSKAMESTRTEDRNTRVVAASSDCRGIVSAVALSAAKIVVQGPAGAAAVPSGFANAGLAAAGGGISGTTLAVVGAGVVGAGALAATKFGNDTVSYEGPMSGQTTITFGPCLRVESYSMNLVIDLTGDTGGSGHGDSGTYRVVSATNCATGPQTGATNSFGMSETPLTRSGSAISFAYRQSDPAGGELQIDFTGALNGDAIGGTVTLISRVPNLTGTSVSAPLVAPVTLTRK